MADVGTALGCSGARPRGRHAAQFAGGADRPAAEARRRRRARAVPDRLQDLRHAQRRPQQRGADLPRADRRPARREPQSGDRQARLVGDHGRPRQADRHRALLRHLPERDRRLHGHDRPGLDQSQDRQAVGPRFSRHHHPRHGARAGHAARRARHRLAVLGRGRLDGRHAGAAMGRELSQARVQRAADRLRDAPFGAEHRLP